MMKMTLNQATRFLASALVGLATAGTAQAATYTLSGKLGTTTYTGPLNGGSFSGSFDFNRPSMGAFDILLFDASHVQRAELTLANSHATFISNFGRSGYDAIQFVTNGPDANATILSLDFPLGFTGVGTVVPYPNGYPFASFATLNGQTAQTTSIVASGFAAAVPEPASWALFGVGMAALLARRLRRHAANA